jgi:hypothetical protein
VRFWRWPDRSPPTPSAFADLDAFAACWRISVSQLLPAPETQLRRACLKWSCSIPM